MKRIFFFVNSMLSVTDTLTLDGETGNNNNNNNNSTPKKAMRGRIIFH